MFFCVQVGVLDHTGDIAYIIAIHTKSACNPNFNDFPWGVQVNYGKNVTDITKICKDIICLPFPGSILGPKPWHYCHFCMSNLKVVNFQSFVKVDVYSISICLTAQCYPLFAGLQPQVWFMDKQGRDAAIF